MTDAGMLEYSDILMEKNDSYIKQVLCRKYKRYPNFSKGIRKFLLSLR
jgi:hypothetical protein